ncbi:MAG: transcription-repair coupling factor [Saccharofermentans sp.]|nr:transcription-repair coupling factor [Saccharofermentans sp.]
MNKSIVELLELIDKDKRVIPAHDECVRMGTHLNVSGLSEGQKGFFIAALSHKDKKKPVVITSDYGRARTLATFLNPFVEGEVVVVKPSELSLVSAVASSRDTETERTGPIYKLLKGNFGAAIICAGALTNLMIPHKTYEGRIIKLKLGLNIEPEQMIKKLFESGYERVAQVTAKGEYSSRGDIVDVFPPDMDTPLRISFFDDEIDQIKTFDTDNQRSLDSLKSAAICPAQEITLDPNLRGQYAHSMELSAADDINHMNANSERTVAELLHRTTQADVEAMKEGVRITGIARWLSILIKTPESILDYVDRTKCKVFVDEMSECRSRIDGYAAEYTSRCKAAYELGSAPKCAFNSMHDIADVMKRIDKYGTVITVSCLGSTGNGLPGGKTIGLAGLAGENWRGRDKELATSLKKWKNSRTVKFMLSGVQRTDSFRVRMLDESVTPDIIPVAMPEGFVYPEIDLVLIGEQEIFGSEKKISTKKSSKGGNRITFFGDIEPGDYVVHDAHGIGQYKGIVNLRMGKSSQDYLEIAYAKNATIHIPVDRIDKLQKYVGPAGSSPKLSSLDSGEWKKNVERARTSIKKLAFDLVKLYASRRASKGYSCEPDDTWQKQFEESFPYVETDDQLMAIRDIKRDMESDTPMDRLLCGDVGFGKTEVAFRAIFKAVTNGRQAFLLAPTTLLAQQHYDNFIERLAGFPMKVALLSRFVQPAVLKENLKAIKEGKVDVVIGTHRILSDDVVPRKLGLLIIDEEQRFGVNHKEKIKALRNNIDVLSLSATPIPRTLHMSMSGIRDISVLNEAPMNRRPVQTYVVEYDEEIVVQACMREIGRGGQIFYLYNRTADIDKKAAYLESIMPGVKIAYAHGKMSEHQMERIIESFIAGEADVLVCTTIIESGVDMPNVNTMIVEDADRFGLAQLYQIKGRVGRSDRQAYAYITYNPEKEMNSDARKRLMAIREFTELGSGIKVAMRDLEVRGAGNLLGAEQHGQMDTIGYELYCRILDEEIKVLREDGEEVSAPPRLNVSLEVDFDSYIPARYIADEAERMAAYRRIANIVERKDYDDFIDEVTDRYGDPPKEVNFLAGAALIRGLAASAGFDKVIFKDAAVLLYFAPDRKLDKEAIGRVVGTVEYAGHILFCAQGKPYLHYKPRTKYHHRTVSEIITMLEIILGK